MVRQVTIFLYETWLIFLRADARIHVSGYSGDLNIQKAQTFVDGIIHLCVGPRPNPSIAIPIVYVRPVIRGVVRPVGIIPSSENISPPVGILSSSEDVPHPVGGADSSEDGSSSDDDESTASPASLSTTPNHNLIPEWVMDVLSERLQDSGRSSFNSCYTTVD